MKYPRAFHIPVPRLRDFTYALIGSCISLFLSAGSLQAAHSAEVPQTLLFKRISTDMGLSHTAVRKIMQDSRGFIWIGTQQGLNRFDGHEFEVFNHLPEDHTSLSNDYVYDIFEDRRGRIWIATEAGLNLYQPRTGTFQHYRHEPGNPSSLPHNSVRTIFQAQDGALWVGTRLGLSRLEGENSFRHFLSFESTPDDKIRPGVRSLAQSEDGTLWIGSQHRGLFVLGPDTDQVEEFSFPQGVGLSGGDRNVRSILIDDSGLIWLGTHGSGITLMDPESGDVERLTREGTSGLSSNQVRKIYQDSRGEIWVATEGGGLNRWVPGSGHFVHFKHDPTDEFSLSDDVVYEIIEDSGNVIWLGTFTGISKWNADIPSFTHVRRNDTGEGMLSNNKISSFAEAGPGTIWVGTIGGGVNRWDRERNSFEVMRHDEADPTSLGDDMVMALLQDDQGRLWTGTMRSGISRLSPETGEFVHFRHDANDPDSLSSNAVSNILQDKSGRIWIATYGGGLNLYREDGGFDHFSLQHQDSVDRSADFLVDMEEGPDGALWLGSDGGGLIRLEATTGVFEVFAHDLDASSSLSGNHVISLLQTEDALWVGTRDTGLNRYRGETWENFSRKGGLLSNAIYGLLEDDSGRIWVSHGRGMSMYDPESDSFTDYSKVHGLQSTDFNNGAFLRTREGLLLFGGTNGFNIFDPADIRGNQHVPPVVLTNFTKFNHRFNLERPAYDTRYIELEHSDYVVGFEFAALDYTDPTKNLYRYKLEGFDKEWVSANGVPQATYTNLDAGKYVFRVQGSNNDGLWNTTGLSVQVRVNPPFWATWWAFLGYLLVAAFSVYFVTRLYRARLFRQEQARHNRELAGLVAERTSALETEINEHKQAREKLSGSLREKEVLLKEVHHRVKNNMQVISSLLNIQADSVTDDRYVNLLTESQQRIKSMALIHENLYRSENLLEIDFHEYIEMLTNGLLRFYRFEDLVVKLEQDVDGIFLDVDTAVPCGLIINELVSNALKHAFEGCSGERHIRIDFHLFEEENLYRFSVEDDGIGLGEDVNLESSNSLGLEIVRILTQQLDGELSVHSERGARFEIAFPRRNG